MTPKPHQIVDAAVMASGYRASLASDLRDVATLVQAAEVTGHDDILADEEVEAVRVGAVTALVVASQILAEGRRSAGCSDLADVAALIARVGLAAYRQTVADAG